MLFAVVSPIVVLAYCYTNFDFDREVLLLNVAVFPKGSFEREALMMANPSEISLFRTSFDSLRIQTPTDFLLRIGMNLSFCNRLKRVVEVQVARRKRSLLHRRSQRSLPISGQRSVPLSLGLVFALFSIAVIVVTHTSITASSAACAAYPECVVYAQRWNTGATCPCLALIDVDKAPKTYGEWIQPVDKTETVKQLARSGDLRLLQLINRRLKELPIELQRCTDMRHM